MKSLKGSKVTDSPVVSLTKLPSDKSILIISPSFASISLIITGRPMLIAFL